MNVQKLFEVIAKNGLSLFASDKNILAHLDDTILRKRGKKVLGAAWRRDPLGPPFQNNLIWGQRFIQMSMSIPQGPGTSQSRALPVDFFHCPSTRRPNPKANEEEVQKFKELQAKSKLSQQGVLRMIKLRETLNDQGCSNRKLCISVDGSYTNKTVLKQLPANTTLIGRIRKDTKLYNLPDVQSTKGRKKVYGQQMPTPEQVRKGNEHHYTKIKAWAAGEEHDFKVKVIKNLRWRAAGEKHTLQLMVISPLGYRLKKASKILYKEPAYLICTDNTLDTKELLQSYLSRWEIEVNFRDEKTLLGCGQAQVREAEAVEKAPAFSVAMYAFLHLASMQAHQSREESALPRAKWDPPKAHQRLSTTELINLFRLEKWTSKMNINFAGFVAKQHKDRTFKKDVDPMISALFYGRN